MNFPEDLKYTKEHEWCRIKGNRAVVGITDHAQDQLGDIVYFALTGRQPFAGGDGNAILASQLAGKVDAPFEDLGAHQVKNMARPLHVFAWGGAIVEAANGREPQTEDHDAAGPAQDHDGCHPPA